ncbi:MAG: hypothetical protein V3V16_16030 [Melioribacteraceae bacterium]
MKISVICILAIFISFTKLANASLPDSFQGFIGPNTDYEGLIVTPLSFDLIDKGIRAKTKVVDEDTFIKNSANVTDEVKLAIQTGYAILINSKDDFDKLKDVLKKNGYTLVKPIIPGGAYVALPGVFYKSGIDLDIFLEGKYGIKYEEWLSNWDNKRIDLNKKIKDLQNILNSRQQLDQQRTELESQNDKLTEDIDILDAQIQDIHSLIHAVEQNEPGLFGIVGEKPIFPPFYEGYTTDEDPFTNVLRDHLSIVDPAIHPWLDLTQISTFYLHADLISSLDRLYNNEKAALKKLGLWPLKLVSIARTPYRQSDIRRSGAFAAGMFSSSHIFGTGVDFKNKDAYRNPENRKAIQKLFSNYGVVLPTRLNIKDPNHGYLEKFYKNTNGFGIKWRLKMLSAYESVMITQNYLQPLTILEATKQKEIITSASGRLTAAIHDLTFKNNNLEKSKGEKQKTLSSKKSELRTKKSQVAEFRTQKDRGKGKRSAERYRDHIRDFNGHAPSDNSEYWEHFSHIELSVSDGETTITFRYSDYEDSDGDLGGAVQIDIQDHGDPGSGGSGLF